MHHLIPVVLMAILMAGCQGTPERLQQPSDSYRATVNYQNLQGEPRSAVIGLHQVYSDKRLSEEAPLLPKSDKSFVALSYRADGIYAESKVGDDIRLVKGKNLTDPSLSITPDQDLYVLSYIAMQGRKPVLKIRTIHKGRVNPKGFVVPLSSSVDKYDIGDFSREVSK